MSAKKNRQDARRKMQAEKKRICYNYNARHFSPSKMSTCFFLAILYQGTFFSRAFMPTCRYAPARWNPGKSTTFSAIKEDTKTSTTTATSATTTKNETGSLTDGDMSWNETSASASPGSSLGNLLLNMQKKEEAMLGNESSAFQDALDLSKSSANLEKEAQDEEEEEGIAGELEVEEIVDEVLDTMDWETARELDDSITKLQPNLVKTMNAQLQLLEPTPLFKALWNPPISTLPELPLSFPEHYRDRIERDKHQLAISIAGSTETVSQWRLFCKEGGGLYSLLEVISTGANKIDERKELELAPMRWKSSAYGQSLASITNACRSIRDLCAISPEVAAVITDGILRANASSNNTLFEDFTVILQNSDEYVDSKLQASWRVRRRQSRERKLTCKLYLNQLLLAMVTASDDAVDAIRATAGLSEALLALSSYAPKERRKRWLRYPGELIKSVWRSKSKQKSGKWRSPFIEAASLSNDMYGKVQGTANQILASIGYNKWIPKSPGQKGLRILSLDGGGSRGMTAVTAVQSLLEQAGRGADVSDVFDMVVGTSTGGIIAFLTGLRRESSVQAVERYNQLIKQIFVKSALSTTMMLFTTASYDESPFMNVLSAILKDEIMLDSRADPSVPLVFCVTSKMSSTPTHVALFRNYNYAGGELPDPFTIDPEKAREDLNLPVELEHKNIQEGIYSRKKDGTGARGFRTSDGSRYPGSFRVLQRYALRASTAAPTVFKPVMMGGEMYCDGGIVASNPTALAIHEARTLFPDVPVEMVVSVGTGGFLEQKSPPRIGWDGIIGQIVNSATDAESIHHILEDVLGDTAIIGKGSSFFQTKYFRFNPILGMPDEFPIDVTDPDKLARLRTITREYMAEPEQARKIEQISAILHGRRKK